MPNQPTHATAMAAGGAAGAVVVIVAWGLSLAHVEVPAEVAAAAMVIVAPLLHLVAVRLGVPEAQDMPEVPAPVPAPIPAPAPPAAAH